MARQSYWAWEKVIACAFPGNKRIKTGRPHTLVVSDPANNVPSACPKGTLILDSSNAIDLSDNTARVYICTVANTTLVEITGN